MLQVLLFVVAIALGRRNVTVFRIVVLVHLGRQFAGLVIVLGRFSILDLVADPTLDSCPLLIRRTDRRVLLRFGYALTSISPLS
jgi:hypothetical protein